MSGRAPPPSKRRAVGPIATPQSAAAELVIMDWNWRSRAFVTSVASYKAPRPSYSSEPESTFHGNPLATPSDWRMMAP